MDGYSVVTGGSNGIGEAVCRRLLGAGPGAAAADISQKYAVESLVNNAVASIPADLEDVTEI